MTHFDIILLLIMIFVIWYIINIKSSYNHEGFLNVIYGHGGSEIIPDNCKCICGDNPPSLSYGIDNSCRCYCDDKSISTRHTDFIQNLGVPEPEIGNCGFLKQNIFPINDRKNISRYLCETNYERVNQVDNSQL